MHLATTYPLLVANAVENVPPKVSIGRTLVPIAFQILIGYAPRNRANLTSGSSQFQARFDWPDLQIDSCGRRHSSEAVLK